MTERAYCTVQISEELHMRIKEIAVARGVDMVVVVDEALGDPDTWTVPKVLRSSALHAPARAGTLCALCTRDILEGSGIAAPLGRDGAFVTICAPCHDDKPQEGGHSYGTSSGGGRQGGYRPGRPGAL